MVDDDLSEIEVIDEFEELILEYTKTHESSINPSFMKQMKIVFNNQRKRTTKMTLEMRNMRKEHSNLQTYQFEILKELKREQSKPDKHSVDQALRNEVLQKELLEKQFILTEKDKHRKNLENLVKEKNKRIACLELTLDERNNRLLLIEKACHDPYADKNRAWFESTINNLQNNIQVMNNSTKGSHVIFTELIKNRQLLIKDYQKALHKVFNLVSNESDRDKSRGNSRKEDGNEQIMLTGDNLIDEKDICGKRAKIVLVKCAPKRDKFQSKPFVRIQYPDESMIDDIKNLPGMS